MDLINNPITEVFVPIQVFQKFLYGLFPPQITPDGIMLTGILPWLIGIMGLLLIIFPHKFEGLPTALAIGILGYWYLLSTSIETAGTPNYALASLGLALGILIGTYQNHIAMLFLGAILGILLAVLVILAMVIQGVSLISIAILGFVVYKLSGYFTENVKRQRYITIGFIVIHVLTVFVSTSFVFLFILLGAFGGPIFLTSKRMQFFNAFISGILAVLACFFGWMLLVTVVYTLPLREIWQTYLEQADESTRTGFGIGLYVIGATAFLLSMIWGFGRAHKATLQEKNAHEIPLKVKIQSLLSTLLVLGIGFFVLQNILKDGVINQDDLTFSVVIPAELGGNLLTGITNMGSDSVMAIPGITNSIASSIFYCQSDCEEMKLRTCPDFSCDVLHQAAQGEVMNIIGVKEQDGQYWLEIPVGFQLGYIQVNHATD